MTIISLTDKKRKLPIRAIIRRKGHKTLIRHFPDTKEGRKDAELWEAEQLRSIRLTGMPLTIDELRKRTVKEIVEKYLDEVTPEKGSAESESLVLKKFLREDPLAKQSLAGLSKQDGYAYIKRRDKAVWKGPKDNWKVSKPITRRTIYREVGSIRHVFEVAKDRWGFPNLINPFLGVEIKGSKHRRKRSLKPRELIRLHDACKKCLGLNRIYVPLAINLAVETGMRLQEIFNLTWDDIDLEQRRIEIRKSKTDYIAEYAGRTIVVSAAATVMLMLHFISQEAGKPPKPGPIFRNADGTPLTKGAFKQSWTDVKKRAKIAERLTFHDLRHEAGTRFDQANLSKGEHDHMMGHEPDDTRGIYVHAMLQSIQDKLDKFDLGKPLAELLTERQPTPERLKKLMARIEASSPDASKPAKPTRLAEEVA